ncbi:MAG: helix-turn-helix domain-containing protein [Proteobacteria bacterium]|nr:helix-turn-helix domain-containing protein [Pseudomonadota bacterium]MCL2308015.1 helix-turn-helix domain-containing protein [Pseudomonadota bacterium]
MAHVHKAVPEPKALLRAWMPFKELIGVTSVHTEEDYARAQATIEVLLDEIGDNENHPLTDVLGYLADQVVVYEEERCPIPEAEPREVLRFLMDQHGLKQDDLADCAPQSRISDILNGRRDISKETAKKLARRFNVSVALFL